MSFRGIEKEPLEKGWVRLYLVVCPKLMYIVYIEFSFGRCWPMYIEYMIEMQCFGLEIYRLKPSKIMHFWHSV